MDFYYYRRECLTSILCVTRLYRMQNTAIRALTDVNKTITEITKEKRLKWVGYLCRKENTSMMYTAHTNKTYRKTTKKMD